MTERLGDIDDQRHLRDQARNLRHRLGRPHLVVRGLHRRCHRAGFLSHRGKLGRVDPAKCVDAHRRHPAAPRDVLVGGVQDRGMLDGGVREGGGRPTPQQTEHRGVQRLRPAGRKADLVRASAETLGDGLPGRLEQHRRPATRAVQPSRIRPAGVERGDERLTRHRVQRSSRGRVEIPSHASHASVPRRSTPHRPGVPGPVRSGLMQEDLSRGGPPVQRRRWGRVYSRAALGGALLLLLTSCSTSDLEKRLRFGWPTGVTKQAERMRVLWSWSGVVALAMGVLVWGLIFWACGRYHKRNDEIPRQTKYNLPIEIVYTVVPLMIVAGLFFFTVRVEDYVDIRTPNPAVTVQVNAFKWNWQFEYLKANGNDTTYPGVSPPLPLSTVGSSGEIPILLIPRGEQVLFVEHSEDVIHSFWVPEFLFKRDVIPYGTDSIQRDNRFEITATTNGHYVGRCAELCGTYHSQMNFEVRVVDPDKFTSYLSQLAQIGPTDPARQYKALAAIGEVPVATTTHPFNTNRTARSESN